jgi:UDP-glucose 4-epimerase|tara:strand:- start:1043 stop:1933 length:891 start_codon:yes stop_codon:yes gene_type:complete
MNVNKRAILFGANGYLGRHIAYFLKQKNIEFIPIGRALKSIDNHPNYLQIDITNKAALTQLNFNVDYVFAFAGLTGTGSSKEEIAKFTEVNEQGLSNLIVCCKSVKDVRIIFPSTRLVYKGVKNLPLVEDAVKESKTIYAKNKLVCEQMLASSNVKHTIFRICVPYGNLIDEVYSYGTIGFFIDRATKGENITIYGDGSLKRTFTHVRDITESIFRTLEFDASKNEIYNIGSNDNLSLLDVATLVARKYNVNVEFVDWPAAALKIESGDTIFDGSKLNQTINYRSKESLKEWVSNI